jgi:g-D-glutamyl-meso-diaminopimelate peptidase
MEGAMFRTTYWVLLITTILAINPVETAAAAEKVYTYEMMTDQLNWLNNKYKNELQMKTVGVSHFGRKIFAVKLGTGDKNVLLVGAHHGREWMTSLLLMNMLGTYADAFQKHQPVGPYSTDDILKEVSIWFLPMLNPDGVAIQQNYIQTFPNEHQNLLMYFNQGWDDYTRWKANGLGVDLNRQYPAGWEALPKIPNVPSYQYFKGKRPLEAAEVKALTNFVDEIQPKIAVAYHTAGHEIYWKYKNGENLGRDRMIAKKTANLTKYKLAKPPKEAFGGGFTDWFITAYHRPAMTIEISCLVGDRHPPLTVFNEEWKRNRYVGIMLAKEAKNIVQ